MIINTFEITNLLKKRKNYKTVSSLTIGSAIKYKRKQQKLTLKEVAYKVCSISYLSKLENNLIEPNDEFVIPIIKRLNIEETFEKADFNLVLDDIVDAFVTKRKLSDEKYKEYEQKINYQAVIFKMAYFWIEKDIDKVLNLFSIIKLHFKYLKDYELSVVLFIIQKILFMFGEYNNSYEINKVIPFYESTNFKLIIDKDRLLSAFKMNKNSEISNFYNEIIEKLFYEKMYEEVNELLILKDNYELGHSLNYEYKNKDSNYVKGIKEFYFQKYQESEKYIKEIKDKNEDILILELKVLDKQRKKEEILEKLKSFPETLNKTYRQFTKYLKYKYVDEDKLIKFLRKDLIINIGSIQDYQILKYLYFDIQRIFSKRHFYKEATTFSLAAGILLFEMIKT